MKKLSLFVFMMALLSSVSVMGQESRLSGSADIDLYSKYIWRGQVVADVPSLQPGVSISVADVGPGSLSFSYWGSSMLKDSHADGDHFAENDYTVSYAFDIGKVSADFGAIYYTFPQFSGGNGDGFSTTEIYASFGMGIIDTEALDVGVSLAGYYDTDDIQGYYLNLGVGAEFAITGEISGGLSIGLGYADRDYNSGYFGVNENTWNDLVIEASAGMPLNDTFSLSAAIGYVNLIDSDFSGAEDEAYAKVGISASF